MSAVIRVENLSKFYKLGLIGGGTLRGDLERGWAKLRGKPDPLLKIGEKDHGNQSGEYIWALRDINFEVQQGEVLGIIGKNGAGKSTLLKILSHITAPTSGSVKIKGRIGALLEVGTGFHPELTGRENVYLNGAILGMTKAEVTRKFDEIVDFSGVEQFIDTPVKRYSSGMKVRLAFAVAAHLDPEILVIDEVLAVGDAEFQKKCLGKMGEVANEGRTVLFVSHNMAAVTNLCGNSILLRNGQFALMAKTDQVINAYLKSNQSSVDLHSPRLSSGRDSFELTYSINTSSESSTDTIRVGDPMDVNFIFKSNLMLRNAAFGLGIEDHFHQRLLTFHTLYQSSVRWDINLNATFSLHWPRVILLPGTYFLIAALYSDGELMVSWDGFGKIEVIGGDFYGTGKLPDPSHQGKVLTESKWNLPNLESTNDKL